MCRVVRKRKKTLFGRVVKKIESELAPQKDKMVSSDVPLDKSSGRKTDEAIIQSRRGEMKLEKNDNCDVIIDF
jgi:hypothetical protein